MPPPTVQRGSVYARISVFRREAIEKRVTFLRLSGPNWSFFDRLIIGRSQVQALLGPPFYIEIIELRLWRASDSGRFWGDFGPILIVAESGSLAQSRMVTAADHQARLR